MPEPTYLTAEGAEKLKQELAELKGPRRDELSARLRSAIQMGDLSENADYHKAKEDQGFLEGRIQEIEHMLQERGHHRGARGPRGCQHRQPCNHPGGGLSARDLSRGGRQGSRSAQGKDIQRVAHRPRLDGSQGRRPGPGGNAGGQDRLSDPKDRIEGNKKGRAISLPGLLHILLPYTAGCSALCQIASSSVTRSK